MATQPPPSPKVFGGVDVPEEASDNEESEGDHVHEYDDYLQMAF
jgi:hypothetical protein